MIVLDTDILSLLFMAHPKIAARAKTANQEVVTTIVSRIETLQGRFDTLIKAVDGKQLQVGYSRLVQAEIDLNGLRVLGVTAIVADEFDSFALNEKFGRLDVLIY